MSILSSISELRSWHSFSGIHAGLGSVPFIDAHSDEELANTVTLCRHEGIRLLALGRGSNFIGSDFSPENTAVIQFSPPDELPEILHGTVCISCHISLSRFIAYAAEKGWGGMASLAGIPGSIGGALAMNAGANGSDISQFVVAMNGIDLRSGSPWNWPSSQQSSFWSYRQSPVPPSVLLTRVTLKLNSVIPENEKKLINDEKLRRSRVTPPGFSCGSVFRNPPDTSAGALLEQAGCKGMTQGVFSVSHQHANWIVNISGQPGSAADCLTLMQMACQAVQNKYNISLCPEWRIADCLLNIHSQFLTKYLNP